MGSKYTSQAASGYNASPPSDDGTASESNKVKWSTIKTKLADVVKTLAEGINTALVTALDHSARSVTASDTAAASDNERTIEVKTSSVSITLSDAATMGAGYIVNIANQSSGNTTVQLATATDTIDMVTNATATIPAKAAFRYIVNAASNGYITVSSKGDKQPTRTVLTSGTGATYTTPTGATRLNVQVKGGGGSGNDGGDGSGNGGGGGGGGGGEGGTAVKLIVGPSATYTYTVGGAASNSSFGSITGNGGSAGTTGSTTPRAGTGGAGGGGSGGDYYIYGAAGQSGDNGGGGNNINVGGLGGSGGGAGSGKGGSAGVNGTAAATNSGAGGGGGGGGDGGAGAHGSGGGGASGIIIVDEYYD